jgi:hypothetical protein
LRLTSALASLEERLTDKIAAATSLTAVLATLDTTTSGGNFSLTWTSVVAATQPAAVTTIVNGLVPNGNLHDTLVAVVAATQPTAIETQIDAQALNGFCAEFECSFLRF